MGLLLTHGRKKRKCVVLRLIPGIWHMVLRDLAKMMPQGEKPGKIKPCEVLNNKQRKEDQ